MSAIGITGGISTGKTTFADCLRELLPQAEFFNADRAARELTDGDPAVREEIVREFGGQIYSPEGHLNRGQLRATVFQSNAKRRALEKILHPRIRQQWRAKAESYRESSVFFFADIPLLYETGGEILCDAVVVVACYPELQLARLLQRTRLSRDEAGEIIKSQMSLEEKMKRANHLVWNNGGLTGLMEQARLLTELWRKS